ncbi:heat shock protein 30C-like [Discoglossus pictus]
MFPLSLLQSSHTPLCVCREPSLTLWPATQLIFGQLEDDMLSMRNDMERRMQHINQAYQLLSKDVEMRQRLGQIRQSPDKEAESISLRKSKEGKGNFELTLDMSHFSPDELTVKTEGRRLIVTGKHEKKNNAGDGNYFHEYREWKRETELPEGVNPEEVLVSLFKDGQLHIQAPQMEPEAAKERQIPISISQAPEDKQESIPQAQSSNSKEEPEN